MDLKGSLIDTNLCIYPSDHFLKYIKTIPIRDDIPNNILKFINETSSIKSKCKNNLNSNEIQLNDLDFENIERIKKIVNNIENEHTYRKVDAAEDPIDSEESSKQTVKEPIDGEKSSKQTVKDPLDSQKSSNQTVKDPIDNEKSIKQTNCKEDLNDGNENTEQSDKNIPNKGETYLLTSDINWLYIHLKDRRNNGQNNVPYLHELLEGSLIEMPENEKIKRNPVLEARCVKLRAQQEAREYRKMTKSVDNVRIRFPEDSISYQLKHLNRQLIAIGQFLISIFAGFLFGFKGIEWTIGTLDFGFRLLLGVMCALVIALAEIYFLAKKLNEELNVPETVQLGGPPKFAEGAGYEQLKSHEVVKEHQD